MTQHHFFTTHTGQPACLVAGWDSSIGHYLMFIEPEARTPVQVAHPESNGEISGHGEVVFSNVNETGALALTLDYYKAKLLEMGISVPAQIFEQIETDWACNTGNRCLWYEPDGTILDTPPVRAEKPRMR